MFLDSPLTIEGDDFGTIALFDAFAAESVMENLHIVRLVSGTVFVLAILIAGAYLLRRYSAFNKGAGDGSTIRILTVRNLSPSHKLAVVEYGGKKLLIGYTKQFMCKLDSVEPQPDQEFKAQLLTEMNDKGAAGPPRVEDDDRPAITELKKKVGGWKL